MKNKNKINNKLISIFVTLLGEQGARKTFNNPSLLKPTHGTWNSGDKTNNTGHGRQGDTGLKNTRKSNEEEQKQVRSN